MTESQTTPAPTKLFIEVMCEDAIGLNSAWTRVRAEQLRELALRGLVPQASPEAKLASEEMISVAYAMSIPCQGCDKTALDFVEGAQASDGQDQRESHSTQEPNKNSTIAGPMRSAQNKPVYDCADSHPTPPQGSGDKRVDDMRHVLELDRQDALCDSAYIAGAKAGHNVAQSDDPEALNKLIATRAGYLKVLTAASAQSAGTNYVCDDATFPQRVEFANGRVVKMRGQGHLFVCMKGDLNDN